MNKLVEESRPPDTFTGGCEGPGDEINHVTLTRNHDDIYIFLYERNRLGRDVEKGPTSKWK